MRTACTSCRWNQTSFAARRKGACVFTAREKPVVRGSPWSEGCRSRGPTKLFCVMPSLRIRWTLREFILAREAESCTPRKMKENTGRAAPNRVRQGCFYPNGWRACGEAAREGETCGKAEDSAHAER